MQQLLNLTEGCIQSENVVAELKQFLAFEKPDKEIVNLLVDKIFVHMREIHRVCMARETANLSKSDARLKIFFKNLLFLS